MKDMMIQIYDRLLTNQIISEKVGKEGIKFYQLPETFNNEKPFIIVDVLAPATNAYRGSNKVLSQQLTYQINVESTDRLLTKEIARAVRESMCDFGFGQLSGGLDRYFSDTKRFVDARRYRKNTKIYETEF